MVADDRDVVPSNGKINGPEQASGAKNEERKEDERRIKSIMKKYRRGPENAYKGIADKKLKSSLRKTDAKFRNAVRRAAGAEILLPDEPGYLEAEGLEKTYHFAQPDIADHLDINSTRKVFDLKLDELGPYNLRYTRNGRYLLLGGRKGHVAMLDWARSHLMTELQVAETIRDVTFLHNETMFAVAQKKYTYIYDMNGVELHCLKKHLAVNRLDYLPYHFLLVSVGRGGILSCQDTSTGALVSEWRTKLGPCDVLRHNPRNAVVFLGHNNGTVTMWTPNMSKPVVKTLCHRGPVQALAIDPSGMYSVTTGLDGQVKVWDLRTYKQLQAYYSVTPAESLDISQRGLLAVAHGPHVEVWKDAFTTKQRSPYMANLYGGRAIRSVRFCPFDDALAVGHSGGVSSMIVPGAGEPNYDSMEADPFQTKKQRREAEVHSLLDKVRPEMITLDPNMIGRIERTPKEHQTALRRIQEKANEDGDETAEREPKEKKKTRGRNKAAKRARRRQANVIDKKMEEIKEKALRRAEKEQKHKAAGGKRARESAAEDTDVRPALARFAAKKVRS